MQMTPAIVEAVHELFSTTAEALSGGEGVDSRSGVQRFAHMEMLRAAMTSALQAYDLETAVVGKSWPSFTRLLASILSDQPLNNPTDDVRAVIFHAIPTDRREIRFTMQLARPLRGQDSLEFMAMVAEGE